MEATPGYVMLVGKESLSPSPPRDSENWVGVVTFLCAGPAQRNLAQVKGNRHGSHKQSTASTVGCHSVYLVSKFIASEGGLL